MNVNQPCLACEGAQCSAHPEIRHLCEHGTAYVYLASFGKYHVKAGVAHETRIPKRWIEQGANIAKRIIVGNGREVRQYEKTIHDNLNVLPGLRTDKKVNTLWKKTAKKDFYTLLETEKEIKTRFSGYPFYSEPIQDLSKIYDLPSLDRKPLEWRIKRNRQLSGTILGVKGVLLLLSLGNLPHFLNLSLLIGRKIKFNEAMKMKLQTALDRF
jgi:hypothetical protein